MKNFQAAVGQLSSGYRNNNPPENFYDSVHAIPTEQKLASSHGPHKECPLSAIIVNHYYYRTYDSPNHRAFPNEQYEYLRAKTENWSRAIFDKEEQQEVVRYFFAIAMNLIKHPDQEK